jgi:hypothetical protein
MSALYKLKCPKPLPMSVEVPHPTVIPSLAHAPGEAHIVLGIVGGYGSGSAVVMSRPPGP